jgi:predicted dehydrogenase
MFSDYREALAASPAAVVLCTPPNLHVEQALAALEAGCHVLTEKPLSDQLSGVPELIAKRDSANLCVMVALCFRFHAGAVRAREILQSGAIGRLVSVRALMGEPFALIRPADYRTMYMGQKGNTGAFDLVHDVDLAAWYATADAPRTPSRVRGVCGGFAGVWPGGAPDTAELLVQFDPVAEVGGEWEEPEGRGSCEGSSGSSVTASVHLVSRQSLKLRHLPSSWWL